MPTLPELRPYLTAATSSLALAHSISSTTVVKTKPSLLQVEAALAEAETAVKFLRLAADGLKNKAGVVGGANRDRRR